MADDPKPEAPKPSLSTRLLRSKDFRNVFTNTFRFRVGFADIGIAFGYQSELPSPSGGDGSINVITDEVEVVLTPTMLKLLQLVIADNVENYEAATGKPIELPQGMLEGLAEQKVKARAELTEEVKAALKPK